jgi:hypothetical protein
VKQKAVGVNDDYREREYLFLRVPLRALHDGLNSVELSPQAADSGGEMEIIRVDLFVGYGPEDTHGAF